MAVPASAHGRYPPSKFRSISPSPPKIAAQIKPKLTPPSICISANPDHINLNHLRDLYAACNHSCHRFPTIGAGGRVEPVDKHKLRTAISHSAVVISAFTNPDIPTARTSNSTSEATNLIGVGGDWIKKMAPVTPENGRLIGFGRAVSDLALTASICDVMVHPDVQGVGIGRSIVKRIVRILANRDIYDIAALCAANEGLFFKACGFGDDILESTTMMYTCSSSSCSEDKQIVYAGRKLLSIPPLRVLKK